MVAFWGALPTALADTRSARTLFKQGEVAFGAGRFAEAARLFEDAYASSHRPELLWNIAQSHRRQYDIDHNMQELRTALSILVNYRQLTWDRKTQDEAQQAIAETTTEIFKAEAESAREREAAAAAERANEEKAERVQRLAPLQSERRWRIAEYSLMGAGGGLLLLGMTFGLLAHSEANTIESTGAPGHPVPFGSVADHESRGQAYQTASYALYGIGAAVAATGGVLLLLQWRGKLPPASRRAAIAPAPGGVAICGRF
jgi:hypothetical protein